MRRTLLSLIILTLSSAAADFSGKWTGTVEGKHPDGTAVSAPAYVELNQKDDQLTGAAGRDETDTGLIRNGKVNGSKINFEVAHPHGAGIYKFELASAEEGKLEGTLTFEAEGGAQQSMKIALTKMK